jgi:hypothetical protein
MLVEALELMSSAVTELIEHHDKAARGRVAAAGDRELRQREGGRSDGGLP